MRKHNEIRLAFLFAAVLVVFCCSAGRARAEYADGIFPAGDCSGNTATPGEFTERERTQSDWSDEIYEEEASDLFDGIDEEATPGSYSEEKAEQAAAARALGYAVYSTQMQLFSADGDRSSDQNNLECSTLEAYAVLTGPDSFEVHLSVAAEPMRFYGFELGRSEHMDALNVFMEDPDVMIMIPDYSTPTAAPAVETVRMGDVRIVSTNITRGRYGRSRAIEICWTVSGTDAAAFGDMLMGDTLFLNLGGEYILPGDGGEDVCSHHGPVEVSGLSDAVRKAGCAHAERVCEPLDAREHSAVCMSCGYEFPAEEHEIANGRCSACGFEVIVSGEIEHILNGRTVTETYTGVEENPLVPQRFAGYFPPDAVMIPKGGGPLTVYHDPIGYRIVTDEESFDVLYDESLFLAGGSRKGFEFEGYEVVDVVSP
ncbi:MAG: hypothetical protein IJR62_07475 [Lachnospiraceae bacterium]|nr:hypothetical protein [Lachnospiraceae bacterium]